MIYCQLKEITARYRQKLTYLPPIPFCRIQLTPSLPTPSPTLRSAGERRFLLETSMPQPMNTPCWNGGGRGASVLAPGALLFLPPPSLQGSSSHFFSSFLPFFQHLSPFLPQILQGTTSRAEGLGCALPWPSQNLPRTSQNQSEAAPASPQRPLSPWAPNTATIKAKFANKVLHI